MPFKLMRLNIKANPIFISYLMELITSVIAQHLILQFLYELINRYTA